MSSLEKQLKRLRIPESSSLEKATKYKKKTSFLFDPKEASDIDNETVFALALNGLDELKLVNVQFEKFETLLFSESSKHLERSLQSEEFNSKLDGSINEYLRFLSPYILLKPAHKTLEWLIRRYQIHLYNTDDLLASVFPYHQSNVFARVVQLLNLTSTKWSWLSSVQKSGSPLPRATIIQHCISNPQFFTFISGLVFNMGKTNRHSGQSRAAYHVFSSFYASTVIGVLERFDRVSEEIVSSLLAQIIHGLKSNVPDLQAAAYMIIGQLTTKCVLESSVIESLLKIMCKNATVQLSEPLLMCINCLCSSHKVMEFPKMVYQTLCGLPNIGTVLPDLSKKYEMDLFLKVYIFHLIKNSVISTVNEEPDEENKTELLVNLLKDIDVKKTTKIEVIRHVLNEYMKRRGIENDSDVAKLECNVRHIVKIIQTRWQVEMDKTIHDYLVSLRNDDIPEDENLQNLKWTQDFVSMALSNIGSQVVCDSGSTLVIALYHPEAEYRKLALKKVSDILKEPMRNSEDQEFLKESLLVKLNDDDPTVVAAVLELNEGLISVCGGEVLVLPLINLMEKSSQKWADVFEKALDILLSNELLQTMSSTKAAIFFHLLPFMFLKKKSVDRAKLVMDRLGKSQLKSLWMVKSLRKKNLMEGFENCTEDSTFEELAIQNAKVICGIVEGMNNLEKQNAFETLKLMQDHANERQDETFVILFLMICCQFVNNSQVDKHKLDVIVLCVPRLLSLVDSVIEKEGNTKPAKESYDGDFESGREDCGIVPISLVASYLHMLKKKKEKKMEKVKSRMYLYILENVVKCLPQARLQTSVWWRLSETNDETNYTKILLAVIHVLFKGLAKGQDFSYQDEFKICLETVVKTQFPQRLDFLKFLTFVWTNSVQENSPSDSCDIPALSALDIVQSLHVAKVLIQSLDGQDMMEIISEQSPVFPSLVVCLAAPITAVRQTALDVISLIVSRTTVKTAAVALGNVVSASSQEILADEAFITSVFQSSITLDSKSSEKSGRQKAKSRKRPATEDVLTYLLSHIVHERTPTHVSRVLLATLNKVVTENFLITVQSIMKNIVENYSKSKDCSSFDQSQILLYCVQKFTPLTAGLLKTEPKIREMFLQLLSFSEPLFPGHVTPQEAILSQIGAGFFEAISDDFIQSQVFGTLVDVLIYTNHARISTKTKDVLKKIPISADQILNELNKSADEEKPNGRKTKKTQAADGPEDWSTSLGPFWQRAIVIIEMLQSKDNIEETETLLPMLFKLLSMCLEISSQTSVDYLKQILLSTMLKICQTHVGQTKGVLSEAHFSVEQIIRCIRVSENPQTHHHALSLLAIAAKLFPEKVLHNIMSIFTFMGINVLRQDDSYSFQVIKRTVEAVIPALVQTEKNERNVQSLVTKVMRVFVDAFPHVPEHRRLPVFAHLLTTLGASRYLHICFALLLEKISNKEAKADTKESGLVFCNFLCQEFSPEVQMQSLVYLLIYLTTLPEEKPEGRNRKRYADSSGIVFDVNVHSGKELHQFKFYGIELILGVLGTDNFVDKNENFSEKKNYGGNNFYLSLLEESLKYITSISRLLEGDVEEMTVKYLRVLLHKVYHIVEKVCDLLPRPAFVSIVSQLIQSTNSTIRRKAMDLFNKRMSKHPRPCAEEEMEMLLSVLDSVMPLMQSEEEPAVNRQSAFNTVVVLSRLLNDKHNLSLMKIFPVAIETFSGDDVKAQVASSALHCLAELCSVLKVHSVPFVPKFLPRVLQILENKDSEKRSDMLLLNALTVLQKVIQSLPNFVSPYLKSILVQLMSPEFIIINEDGSNENSSWKKQIVDLAVRLRADIAVSIKPRILIPNTSQCYEEIVLSKNIDSLIALYQVVDSCITNMTKDDVKNYHNELLSLFMSALDYRSQHAQGISEESLLKTEETMIGAFISLIMRLSESLFRPMFLKLVDWATRSSSAKSRQLVFYHLADRMAAKLKGLFVLFAGYLIKNTASILEATNITKTDEIFFAGECEQDEAVEKSCQLLGYVFDCLYKCFLYDNQRFVNKERFDRLLKPLVDQIENQIGDAEVFLKRVSEHLAPCIAQFAVAAGDESYWKIMNHEICLKTRHSSCQVRLAALKVVQELNHKLGEEYLTLLPEIIPFLAELMEDESFEVEQKCQQVISEMEEVLGESLQKYF